MEKVILTARAFSILANMATTLFEKGYFSYLEDSENYANDVFAFVYSIPQQKHYRTMHHKYGHYYCRYKPNKQTTYYITFDTDGTRYLVKNIISSHTPQYPRYIKGI